MYLHTPALEVGSWWRVDTASGSDTAMTVYAHDGTDAIPTALGTSGSTVRGNTRDGTAVFWSATATLYCKELTYQGVPTGTVVTSTGGTPAAPGPAAPVDIATISVAVAALPTTYVKLLVTDATSTAASGALVAGHLTPINATGGAATWTLPAASSVAAGTPTVAKKADTSANTVTVQRAGSDLIFGTGSGATSKTLSLAGEAVTFVSNGVDRWSVESSDTPSGSLAATYGQLWTTPTASTTLTGTLAAWTVTAVDCTAGAGARALPAASSVASGTAVCAKKSDTTANALVVSRAGSDLIFGTGGGATSKTLSLAGEAVEFVSNGVDKWTVRSSDTPGSVLATTFAPIAATPVASSATSGTLTAGAEHNLSPSSAAAWTLPTGVTATKLPTTVKNNGTAAVTVARGGSDTINGGTASVSIAAGEWARFTSDGAGAWTQSGTAGQSTTYVQINDGASYMPGAFGSLITAMESSQSTAISLLGDSTGVTTARWFYLFGQWLAARYPAFNVRHRLWNDANQDFDASVTIQSGASGDRYARLPGNASLDQLLYQDAASNRITGDIDIRIDCSIDTVPTAGSQAFASKYASAGNRSWRFYMGSDAKYRFEWSADGTTLLSGISGVATTATSGQRLWHRCTFTVSNSNVKFYTSTDGQSWTQVGSTVVANGGAATSIFAGTANIDLGSRSQNGDQLTGNVYEIDIRTGIGTNSYGVVPRNPEAWTPGSGASTAVTFGGSPTLDLINGSVSGVGVSYFNASTTRVNCMLPLWGQSLVFLSDSHNESWQTSEVILNLLDSWLTNIQARLARPPIVFMLQNPRVSPATNIREHAQRIVQIAGWCRQKNLAAVNIFRVFNSDSRGVAALLNSDGIHPSDAIGSPLWAAAVEARYLRGV